jgi:hypothetical protein
MKSSLLIFISLFIVGCSSGSDEESLEIKDKVVIENPKPDIKEVEALPTPKSQSSKNVEFPPQPPEL